MTNFIYTVYQITNTVNNKIYIGAHKARTDRPDYYMGSGIVLRKAIKKYGIKNFKKEVLFVCDSESSMYEKEADIVTEEFISRSDVYNVKTGGSDMILYSDAVRKKISDSLKGKPRSVESRRKQSIAKQGKAIGPKSDDAKNNIRNALRNKPLVKTEKCPLCNYMLHPSHINKHLNSRMCVKRQSEALNDL